MPYQFEMTADDAVLWRYMGVADLVWMIVESRLFLQYPANLEDPFEGELSKPTVENMRSWPGETGEHNRRAIHTMRGTGEAVTCWHRQEHESDLMWRAYASSAGVAIKTTAKRLKDAVAHAERDANPILGDIKYIDYGSEEIDCMNTINPLFHKRREFAHEQESRLVMHRLSIKDDEVLDSGLAGFSVRIDLSHFIDEIVVAPRLAWFTSCLKSLCSERDLCFPVNPSALATNPHRVYEEVWVRALIPAELVGKVEVPRHLFVVAEADPSTRKTNGE